METDTQESKYTGITFMIKSSVQFSSTLGCPIRKNQVGGRILTDVWMYCCSQSFDHSATVTRLSIIYSCAWVGTDPQRKRGRRDVTSAHTTTQRGGEWADTKPPSLMLYTHLAAGGAGGRPRCHGGRWGFQPACGCPDRSACWPSWLPPCLCLSSRYDPEKSENHCLNMGNTQNKLARVELGLNPRAHTGKRPNPNSSGVNVCRTESYNYNLYLVSYN